MRERTRVRGFLYQSRPSKPLALDIARQAGGELIFVVASIGIVARQGSDWQGSDWQGDLRRSAVKSCAVILHKKTGRTLKPAGQIRKRYRTLRRQRTYY